VLDDGAWRAAIASERVSPDVLTAEFGEGWTIIGPAPDEAWWSPWRGPSESFAVDAAQLLHGIVSSLSGDHAASWRHSLDRPLDLAAGDASGASDPAPGSGLASRLAHRAAGGGGPEETWWGRSTPTPDGQALRLRSRRRPGTFRIRPAGTRTILTDPYEFLVPAWSIDELTIDGHSH